MEQSILTGTKKVLGLDSTDTSFDYDVLTFINAAFSTLCDDLGVGPPVFVVEDESATWQDFISDDDAMLSECRTYVFLRVKMLFDPPTTSYLINAYKDQLEEHVWRISRRREAVRYTDPDPEVVE